MKKILLVATLVATSLASFAQVAIDGAFYGSNTPDHFNRVSIGYDANMFTGKWSGGYSIESDMDANITLNGFNIQYLHGIRLTNSVPFYIEFGAKIATHFKNEKVDYSDGYVESSKITKLSLSVPVNISWRFGISNSFSLMPYTGLHFTGNLLAQSKYEEKDKYENYDESDVVNFFSEDEVEVPWKRFQMGWQIGLGCNIDKFYLGFEYGLDFMKLYENCNTSNISVNIGYNF